MFEKFTDRAKRVIVVAQDEAISLGHDFIGTEHLLLGLTGTDSIPKELLTQRGVTSDRVRDETVRLLTEAGRHRPNDPGPAAALASLGIDVDEIRRRADDSFGPGKFKFPRPGFTPRLKRTMGRTLREALKLHATEIGPEHLLLGLLHDPDGVGVKVLIGLGADTGALRSAVLARVAPDET
jgi:ATP-dependent Clp protease ATP-binding subunit ClpC